MNRSIFRQYDIRGRVDIDLNSELVYALGQAFGTTIKRRGGRLVAVGRDCRQSGVQICDALTRGLQATGIDVISLGLVSTPMVYFTAHTQGVDGTVAVTGSHNPPDWNGFKFCVGASSFYGDDIQGLLTLIERADYETGTGSLRKLSIKAPYVEDLMGRLKPLSKPIKVVVDAGNGTGGLAAGEIYRRMGAEVNELFCEPDGAFPNHHPDPTVEKNLVDLKAQIVAVNADLGIAFDGDADRIGVVDRRGRVIWGDQLLTLFGLSLLETYSNLKVVGEVKCSKVMYDTLREAGAEVEMWKVGHSLIKARMKETGSLLAGEMSGHLFFADRFFGFDDAVYAGGRLLEILGESGLTLEAMVDQLPKTYATPELRLACPDDSKFRVPEKAARFFSEHYVVSLIDGVRIDFESGWGLIRASNTQPVLVLRVEATSERARDDYLQRLIGWLQTEAPEVSTTMEASHS
ncbi:MAG: phosphomannomutase/phosphoglucomutase [Bradymonadia bacterium]